MTTLTLVKQAMAVAVSTGCLALATADASYALTFVTNRADLGANDSVDWSQLGTTLTGVSNPFNVTSTGGIDAMGSIPTGLLERRDQNNGWFGNFAPDDAVLWTGGNSGPISLIFSTLVTGAGAQIQANAFGSFIAFIEAFDENNTSLGSFSLSGDSFPSLGDNSAIFIGVFSDTANIKRLNFNIGDSDLQAFGINQLALKTDTQAIPTPALLPGLMGMGIAAWRKRKGEVLAEASEEV